MRLAIRALLLCFLVPHSLDGQAARPSVDVFPSEWLEERLRAFPLKNSQRQERALELFQEIQCPKIVTVPLGKKEIPANVVCIFPGETAKSILVGAHFDKVSAGEGKIDNATGVVLLPALAKAIHSRPRRHTFIYSAFADEELGLKGSAAMVKKGIEEGVSGDRFLNSLSAMVNIDSVGAGVTAVAASSSDPELTGWAFGLAQRLSIPFRSMNVDQVGQSDGHSFQSKKIRTIEFHSLDNSNWKILHTSADNMSAFKGQHYSEAYRWIALYLEQIDRLLDP